MTRFPEGPATSPGFLLWHTTLRWQRVMAAALAPLDLTHVQFVILASTWWLNGQGEHPKQSRLSDYTGSDARMTSEVVGRLIAKGLLERTRDPEDARAKVLTVTSDGAAVAARAIDAVEAADEAFFAPALKRPLDLVTLLQTLAAR
ncbi:MarR family winged helix-turn-helix transcriptional regulator [Diaminobutyricibacter sp. McL0608]|uniref:MarR family winged helix-turn-helix transcriptional regulator n=1 Tax=Leifsonia sp. McL0608 TaxID=3143537 RepID=UPI0031F2F8DA